MKPIHLLFSFTVLLGSVLPMPAADPTWWLGGSPPVIDPAAQPENRAIASIGQAKWMAKNALESLRTILPETAALVEADLVGSGKPIATWAAPITAEEKQAQLSPLLVGQLKAISAPFYQHLQAAAPLWLTSEMAAYQLPPGPVPWTTATGDDSNFSPAVIGQLKAVFSFDFAADRESAENADGISDLWEYTTFNSLLTVTALNAGTYVPEDDPSDSGQGSIDPSALDDDTFDPNLEDFTNESTIQATRAVGGAAPATMSLADFTPSQRKARADTLGISSAILSNTIGCWTFEGRLAGTASFPMIYKDYSGRGNHATNWDQNALQKLGMPSNATKFGSQNLNIPGKVLQNQQSFSLSTWVKFPVSLQVEAESLTRIDDMKPLFSFYQTIPKTTLTSPPLGKGRIFALRKTNGAPNWFIGGYEQTENYLLNAVTNFTGDYFTMPGIDDGRWHHLAVTYATSSYGQEIWLDGKLLKSFPLKNEHYVDFSHPDTQINFGSLPPGRNSFSFSQVHLDRLRFHAGKLSQSQIQSLHQQDIDGDGLWDITETATRYTYGNNLTAFLSSPYITNATNSDTDDDGLKDLAEQNLGTRMDSPDTDGDGLLDGWEYKYRALGLDPIKKNKVGADIDGDGLDWLEEYARATHPGKKDTDGDGQNDKIDPTPNDPTNPPASARFSVLLGIGDKSGSLSENYDLNVYERNPQTGAETRVFTLTSGGHGKYKEETKDFFIKGRSYTFQIDWQSTNGKPQTNAAGTVLDGADFDYTFKVQPQGNTGAVLIDSFSPTDPAATTIQLLSASASDVVQSKSEFVQKYESRRVGLLPVEVAVDADRDGEITFDGNDKTTSEKPYRFWINDDVDKGNNVDGNDYEEDDLNESAKDSEDGKLNFRRDLEDLTRLWIDFSGINSVFPASDPSVALKVRIEADAGSPVINLYQPVETDGGREYLKDENTGYNQLQGIYGQQLCQVTSAATVVPRRAWETLPSDKVVHLLFEGATEGNGKLIFEIWKDGEKKCDLPSVNLNLKKAKDMYETWTVGDVDAGGVDFTKWPAASATQTSGQNIPAPEKPEEKDYIMFVHGWNMPPWEKETFASTMFKRMWHQGYKGRFGAFRWPTFYGLSGPSWGNLKGENIHTAHFDGSEQRAWNSASALKNLLIGREAVFGTNKIRLYAHSMGNIVSSEALRQMAPSSHVNTYISAQAAISSHVWDNTTPRMTFNAPLGLNTPNVYGYYWQSTAALPPHNWENEGRPSYMAPQYMSSGTTYINHYNPLDWALSYDNWQLNQVLKPDVDYNYGWPALDFIDISLRFWKTQSIPPFRNLAFPNDRFEVFSYAAQSHGYATGQQGATAGKFNVAASVNLRGEYGFESAHKGHSAQFRSTIQKRWTYWRRALKDMNINLPTP